MGLRPERVPGVEVVKVFPADQNAAVLEFEDDAAEDVETPAVSLGAVVMNGNHAAIVTFEHIQQVGPEGSAGLAAIAAELSEDRVATPAVAGDGAASGCVPNRVAVEQFGQRGDIGRIEGFVSTANDGGISVGSDLGTVRRR